MEIWRSLLALRRVRPSVGVLQRRARARTRRARLEQPRASAARHLIRTPRRRLFSPRAPVAMSRFDHKPSPLRARLPPPFTPHHARRATVRAGRRTTSASSACATTTATRSRCATTDRFDRPTDLASRARHDDTRNGRAAPTPPRLRVAARAASVRARRARRSATRSRGTRAGGRGTSRPRRSSRATTWPTTRPPTRPRAARATRSACGVTSICSITRGPCVARISFHHLEWPFRIHCPMAVCCCTVGSFSTASKS